MMLTLHSQAEKDLSTNKLLGLHRFRSFPLQGGRGRGFEPHAASLTSGSGLQAGASCRRLGWGFGVGVVLAFNPLPNPPPGRGREQDQPPSTATTRCPEA